MKMVVAKRDAGDVWVEAVTDANSINFTSVNVMESSCVQSFETIACIRSGILAGLATLTAVLCVVKLIRLHVAHHPSCHQYVIFYAASLECSIGAVHWIFWNVAQLDFLLEYIKLLQVLIMCHYYITLAIRALRMESLADRFMYPFLCIAVLYFTVIASLGISNSETAFIDCIAPYWLALSGAELVVVQLFAVSGFYITRRLNEISTLDSVRWAQKRDLWCIVIIFELSALGVFVYDIALQILGDQDSGCSAIFSHRQVVYSPVLITLMVIKLLLPIWVMLFVFQPHVTVSDKDDVAPAYSEEGTYGSVFSEDLAYRQLYQPVDSFTYTTPITSPASSPCMYDAALPYVYTNPSMACSGLQTIAEENNEKQDKNVAFVKKGHTTSPLAEGTVIKTTRVPGQHKRGKFITRIMRKSSKINGEIL